MADDIDHHDDDKQADPLQAKLLEPTWLGVWKEILAYIFGLTILYDFFFAPLFVQIADTFFHATMTPWVSLTAQGGGLYYVTMLGILGVSSWGDMVKTRELIRNMPDHS